MPSGKTSPSWKNRAKDLYYGAKRKLRKASSSVSSAYSRAKKSVKDFMDPTNNESKLEKRLRGTRVGKAITTRQLKAKNKRMKPVFKETMKSPGSDAAKRSVTLRTGKSGRSLSAAQKAALMKAVRASAAKRRGRGRTSGNGR